MCFSSQPESLIIRIPAWNTEHLVCFLSSRKDGTYAALSRCTGELRSGYLPSMGARERHFGLHSPLEPTGVLLNTKLILVNTS